MIFDNFDFDDGEFYNLVVDPYWERDKKEEDDISYTLGSDYLFGKEYKEEDDNFDYLGYEIMDYDLETNEKPKKLTKRKGCYDD